MAPLSCVLLPSAFGPLVLLRQDTPAVAEVLRAFLPQDGQPTEEMLMELELTPEQTADREFYFGKGCDYCNNTGYKGRMGIFEIMRLDDELREDVMNNASTNVLREKALRKGMRTLRDAGIASIFDGLTTIEEVVKEAVVDEA